MDKRRLKPGEVMEHHVWIRGRLEAGVEMEDQMCIRGG